MSTRFFVLCAVLAVPGGGVMATASAVAEKRDVGNPGPAVAPDHSTEDSVATDCASGAAEEGQCSQSPTALMQQLLAVHRRFHKTQHVALDGRQDDEGEAGEADNEGNHEEHESEDTDEEDEDEDDEDAGAVALAEHVGRTGKASGASAPVILSSGGHGGDGASCGITIKGVADIQSIRMCLMSGPCKDLKQQSGEWTDCPPGAAERSVLFQLRRLAASTGDDVAEIECECPGDWPWSFGQQCFCEDSFPEGVSETATPPGWRRLCTPTPHPGSGECALVRAG